MRLHLPTPDEDPRTAVVLFVALLVILLNLGMGITNLASVEAIKSHAAHDCQTARQTTQALIDLNQELIRLGSKGDAGEQALAKARVHATADLRNLIPKCDQR